MDHKVPLPLLEAQMDSDAPGPSVSAYITYYSKEDSMKAIEEMDGVRDILVAFEPDLLCLIVL